MPEVEDKVHLGVDFVVSVAGVRVALPKLCGKLRAIDTDDSAICERREMKLISIAERHLTGIVVHLTL